VLINDFDSTSRALAMVYAGSPLYRSRLTRTMPPASVRQATLLGKWLKFLDQTAAVRIEIGRYYLFAGRDCVENLTVASHMQSMKRPEYDPLL